MRVTYYRRDDIGPVCFEAPLFDDNAAQSTLDVLLAARLSWHWFSVRTRPSETQRANCEVPEHRPLTRLTNDNKTQFLADLTERNDDVHDRAFVLFGHDVEETETVEKRKAFEVALERFIMQESGPFRIIISQVGDSFDEHVFVSHAPITPVKDLLEQLGLKPESAARVRKYRWLGTAKLEDIAEVAGRVGFPD